MVLSWQWQHIIQHKKMTLKVVKHRKVFSKELEKNVAKSHALFCFKILKKNENLEVIETF